MATIMGNASAFKRQGDRITLSNMIPLARRAPCPPPLATITGAGVRAQVFPQHRLFFRYHAPSTVIVFAWLNDEGTKRAYKSCDDACRVSRKMLASGHPPGEWNPLLPDVRAQGQRLQRLSAGVRRKASLL